MTALKLLIIVLPIIHACGAEVDQPDSDNQTPLFICVQNAIVHSSFATVERLLAAGASVRSVDRFGRVPLHSAAHWKVKELLRVLLEAKSYVNTVSYNLQ